MLTQSTWQHYNAATGEGTGTPALTRWIYDPATGQLAQKQHADGKGPSYGYTPGGRLASRTWARGTSTTYVYDDAGMMASLDHSDSTPDVAFSYTRTGQLDTVQDGALSGSGIATPRFTHTYTYSSIGQLTTESSATTVGRTLTRVYEIDGTVPGRSIGWDLHTPDDPAAAPSHWQRYGFDGAGRLNAVSSPAGEYSYTYVDQSHLLASVSGPVHTVTNSYESGRDAMTSKTNAAASGTVSRFGAKYDALGRRVEVNRSGSAFAQNFVSGYQYDLLGQLTSDARFEGATPGAPDQKLVDESFAFLYDGIGNRLTAQKGNDTTAYTPNALNQYTDIDGIEPVYDADGNLFSDGKNRYHWDAENRLTLVEPLVPTEGSKRLEFKYDYIGRRVSKQVWTHTGGSWTDESTTAFVYDGWNLIEEISTSSQSASSNHYTWGLDLSLSLQGAGGVGGLLSVVCAPFTESGLIGDWLLPIDYVSGAPSTFHYTYDLNGNVSELLDSTGTIAAHYEYGPFGELTHEFHSSNSHLSLLTFNFSTKYYDAELKTYYYGYRYYDPTNGRWLNRDPIEESGGLNLYGFVGNDGVNRWDVLGLDYHHWFPQQHRLTIENELCRCVEFSVDDYTTDVPGQWYNGIKINHNTRDTPHYFLHNNMKYNDSAKEILDAAQGIPDENKRCCAALAGVDALRHFSWAVLRSVSDDLVSGDLLDNVPYPILYTYHKKQIENVKRRLPTELQFYSTVQDVCADKDEYKEFYEKVKNLLLAEYNEQMEHEMKKAWGSGLKVGGLIVLGGVAVVSVYDGIAGDSAVVAELGVILSRISSLAALEMSVLPAFSF